MSLKDKVAIITGAGQGIGAAYARRFSEKGARVIIADINQEKSEAVVKEITEKGLEALAVLTDVSDEASTLALVQTVKERYGRIDILVNNAAIFATIKTKPMEEISIFLFLRWLLIKQGLKRSRVLVERRGSNFLFFSSAQGIDELRTYFLQ